MGDASKALCTGLLLLALPVAFVLAELEWRLARYSVKHNWSEWRYQLVASSWLVLLFGFVIYTMDKGGSL